MTTIVKKTQKDAQFGNLSPAGFLLDSEYLSDRIMLAEQILFSLAPLIILIFSGNNL